MKIIDQLHMFPWRSMNANNCNTYLIDGPARILIDPGHLHQFSHVDESLGALGLDVNAIDLVVATHAHPDHVEALQLFRDSPAQTAMHALEWELMQSLASRMGADVAQRAKLLEPDLFLTEGRLDVKGIQLDVYHTPGHSPGSVTLHWAANKVLFTGDLIFNQGLGRTDLPGGDPAQLKASIQRMRDLEVDYLLPGHGDGIMDPKGVAANFDHLERVWFAML